MKTLLLILFFSLIACGEETSLKKFSTTVENSIFAGKKGLQNIFLNEQDINILLKKKIINQEASEYLKKKITSNKSKINDLLEIIDLKNVIIFFTAASVQVPDPSPKLTSRPFAIDHIILSQKWKDVSWLLSTLLKIAFIHFLLWSYL